ncbi:uncharacterized protein LOC122657342 isoform X2 [Telopea speciosissima]|uniref:uncharacterized protein LOC122657342 isoform X2 n=1 Tax=Telopea speciosissima TaxID=54955 RepID=UPI001CC3DFE7|nr:uncharacterized protein LOC122657342 isoform X2 [Telopea speciosissima]
MAKIKVEVCLISARGLRRSSSLWKLQWFAVGWIDPKNKYCTKIDASGNANPTWKTKFSVLIDDSEPNLEGLTLHVEVYSREPIFLREKLQGTATILLKEFLAKYVRGSGVSKQGGVEEVGSFQLRQQQKSSSKPQGFVDVCIRISEDREGVNLYIGEGEGYGNGKGEGIMLEDPNNIIPTSMEYGPTRPYPSHPYPGQVGQSGNYPQMNVPYTHPMPFPANYQNQSSLGEPSYPSAVGPSYRPPRTPPPPPPPSHVGYLPTFLPRTDPLPENNYLNLPSSGPCPSRTGRPNFAMGAGAGALAAGAVIFGDDFMSGFDFPTGLQDASLIVSVDPPF